jgi:hypothetical protein
MMGGTRTSSPVSANVQRPEYVSLLSIVQTVPRAHVPTARFLTLARPRESI